MKILTISDVVETALYPDPDSGRFSGVDLVLSCGDLPPEYLAFLRDRLDAPLLYVRGNHDIRYDRNPPRGCVDIHGRLVRFGPLRILGLEGSRWYNGNPMQYTEPQMRRHIRSLWFPLWWHRGVDIVVTHAPPRFIHDAEDLCHRGFRGFHGLIRRHGPRYFIHGHIHRRFSESSERITRIDDTRVINTCGFHIIDTNEADDHETA